MNVKIIMLVFFGCSYICASGSFSQKMSDVSPEVIVTGNFTVAGYPIEIRSNNDGNIFSIAVNDIVYTLREYHFISQVKYSFDKKNMIMEIMRWNPKYSGAAYQSLLLVHLVENKKALKIEECFSREYLKLIDGHDRFVKTIGSLDNFPVIELEIGYHLKQGYPTDVGYEWTKWNVCSRLPLSRLSPSGEISQ